MTAVPSSSKHGFRAIPLEDFDREAAEHFARTNGTTVEEALFEYAREQYLNQLLTEWQSASQLFCRFIARMSPHASPAEIVLVLRETAKTYDDLVTAGLLMRDGVKLLFLVNELASRILSVPALRKEEEKAARTKNEAALRFALFEKPSTASSCETHTAPPTGTNSIRAPDNCALSSQPAPRRRLPGGFSLKKRRCYFSGKDRRLFSSHFSFFEKSTPLEKRRTFPRSPFLFHGFGI